MASPLPIGEGDRALAKKIMIPHHAVPLTFEPLSHALKKNGPHFSGRRRPHDLSQK